MKIKHNFQNIPKLGNTNQGINDKVMERDLGKLIPLTTINAHVRYCGSIVKPTNPHP